MYSKYFWVIISLVTFLLTNSINGATLNIGSSKQVFIDGRFVESSRGVRLAVNKPHPTGEKLMVHDKPWEAVGISGYCSYIQEGNRIHNWYVALHTMSKSQNLCYAYSDDGGATWIKPNLGICEYKGSYENNIVMTGGHGHTVFRNKADAPVNEKYIMLTCGNYNKAYYSPDGFHWTQFGTVPFLDMSIYTGTQMDSQNIAFYDTRKSKYVIYPRINQRTDNVDRSIGYTESRTFGSFPIPRVIFEADIKDHINIDPYVDIDFYTSAAILYPYAADAYFMFPAVYYHLASPPNPKNDGALNIQFAASRDGENWYRYDRKAIISSGFFDSDYLDKITDDWQLGSVYAGYGLSRDRDKLYLYYTCYDVTHGAYVDRGYLGGIVTRAVYRLDGFTSIEPNNPAEGEFTTPSLLFSGDWLSLNIEVFVGGSVGVEIQDVNNNPLSGFSFSDCGIIKGDSVNKVVAWKGSDNLTSLKNHPVKIHFILRNAKLYAFQFPSKQDSGGPD